METSPKPPRAPARDSLAGCVVWVGGEEKMAETASQVPSKALCDQAQTRLDSEEWGNPPGCPWLLADNYEEGRVLQFKAGKTEHLMSKKGRAFRALHLTSSQGKAYRVAEFGLIREKGALRITEGDSITLTRNGKKWTLSTE